jgi:hypothetical protein
MATARGGGRELSLGKTAKLRATAVATTFFPTDGFRTSPLAAGSSWKERLTALRFRSARHCTLDFHQTRPRGPPPLIGRHQRRASPRSLRPKVPNPVMSRLSLSIQPCPCHFSVGFPPPGPQRTLTSCFAPMPGAPPRLPPAGPRRSTHRRPPRWVAGRLRGRRQPRHSPLSTRSPGPPVRPTGSTCVNPELFGRVRKTRV